MKNRFKGSTATEYGIILGLVVVLSVAALTMLGGSVKKLAQGGATTMNSGQVRDMASLKFGGAGAGKGSGQAMGIDPVTGLPTMQITGTASNGTNTTSAEGSTAQNTMNVANTLQNNLSQITNPTTLNWATQITKLVYYMGGAEGSYEGIDALSVNDAKALHGNTAYTDANALSDVYDYQQQLQHLLQNPPKSAGSKDVRVVTSLASAAFNASQNYVQELTPYIKPDGSLDTKALMNSDLSGTTGHTKDTKASYDDLVKYDTLQQNTQQVLNDGSAAGTPGVQSTLESATSLNTTSTTATAP